jgi:3-methyladenine DNA glycosylase/8-oxoguanine DNA glycosylase
MRRTVRAPGGIDLALTCAGIARGPYDPSARWNGSTFWRATRTPAGLATARYTQAGAEVAVESWGPGAEWIVENAPALLGADDDPTAFRPHHPVLRDMHRRLRGLRLGRTGAVLEALVPSIIEQKVTSLEAHRAYSRLVRAHGERAPGPGGLVAPPRPDAIAALPYYAFHPFGVERKRADAVRHACARANRVEETAAMPMPGAYRRLRALDGVGVWTAAEVARIALGDRDAVSVGDYHLKNLVSYALAGEPRGTDERMLELLEPYRGMRARAVRYIEASGIAPPRRGPRMPVRNLAAI